MVTVITRTIGSSGRDFATFQLAEAATETIGTSADLVANDEAIVFKVDPETFTNAGVFSIQSTSLTTDATRNVSYTAASGQPIYKYTGTGNAIRIFNPYTTWDGIDLNAESGTCYQIRADSGYGTDQAGTIIQNAKLTADTTAIKCQKFGKDNALGTSAEPITVRNVVTSSVVSTSQFISGGSHTKGAHILFVNCTHLNSGSSTNQVWNWALTGGMPDASFKIINCINLAQNASDDANITGGGVDITGSRNNVGNSAASNSSYSFSSLGGGIGIVLQPTTSANPGDGSFSIFSGSTGQLLDSKSNTALNQGVGPSVDSNVPASGIEGFARSGPTTQPGAFAQTISTEVPGLVTNPFPANGAENVDVNTTLSWSEPDQKITSRKVLLGTSSTLTDSNIVATTAPPVTLETSLDNSQEYYWRVDLTNDFGTTSGITFVFDTSAPVVSQAVSDPPAPSPSDPLTGGFGGKSKSGATVGFVENASALNTTWDGSSLESRSRRWPTREGDVRAKIFKMTQAKSNISFIYKESLRSMIASFNDIGYFNSEDDFVEIKCIHGNAERAIAKLKQENNIILPIISVSQTISNNDDERRRYESVLVHEKFFDKEKHRAVRVLSLSPRPVNISYQVNVYTKYMADMDQILEQIRLKFNPEMNVPTEYSTLAKAFLESEEAAGSMTANDKEDRVIKKTLNVVLRTYIPSPKFLVTSTGEIEEFNIEIT